MFASNTRPLRWLKRIVVDEKFFVRVDVTEGFPFLVTKMSPYYER